ncbi:hypothetical protein PVAP13_9KG056700 [Panicum virgatum]|uniref:Uncharacterized protein n=1 Tax=Panicum virgatum TaxID=38727 RepID=A0A8T0NB49_PANVG|nr:hypothetical protein PVAP13_9KG056700 [Panicum virgatum]
MPVDFKSKPHWIASLISVTTLHYLHTSRKMALQYRAAPLHRHKMKSAQDEIS